MKCFLSLCLVSSVAVNTVQAQFATQVVSYNAGSTATPGYTTPSTALGSPERVTGELFSFPSDVTVFNPAFGTDELVSIGEGGQITLQLSNYVLADALAPEIGVFSNVGIIDDDYPNGKIGSPAEIFGGGRAEVAVSFDSIAWESLGIVDFNLPAQGWSDVAGTVPSNFQQPFAGVLSDFDGLPNSDPVNPDVFDLLAGSGGGNWLDISSVPLSKIGYIRFSVADDLNPATSLNFELDAVSISTAATGGVVPEPATLALAGIVVVCGGLSRRHG